VALELRAASAFAGSNSYGDEMSEAQRLGHVSVECRRFEKRASRVAIDSDTLRANGAEAFDGSCALDERPLARTLFTNRVPCTSSTMRRVAFDPSRHASPQTTPSSRVFAHTAPTMRTDPR